MAGKTHYSPIHNEALKDAIVEVVKKGSSLTAAATLAGISHHTLGEWLMVAHGGRARKGHNNPNGHVTKEYTELCVAFAERIEEAIAIFETAQVERIQEAARAVNEKTGIPEWRAAGWLLEHSPHTRASWYTHRETHISVTATPSIPEEHERVRSLTDAELIELIPDQTRLLLTAPAPTVLPKESENA